ncbi:DUF222 domain-containing protein [Gordonia sp. NPDC003424]
MSEDRQSFAAWWQVPSPWPDLPPRFTVVDAEDMASDDTEINDLLRTFLWTERGRSFVEWQDYQAAAELHRRLVEANAGPHDLLLVDGFAGCAARIAQSKAISQREAEGFLRRAVALRDRLPQVAERLRLGKITAAGVRTIIARTDLIDDLGCAEQVDADIVAELDCYRGWWSIERLRHMVDRIVHRHHPDAVRERRRRAHAARRFWIKSTGDGMAMAAMTMTAENAAVANAAVDALASLVCKHDPRDLDQRRADAGYARLSGEPFECLCGRDDCTAQIPAPGTVVVADSKVLVHVVCDESTLTGTTDNPGFVAGTGVVSAEHVRDLARRPDAVIKHLVPKGTPQDPDGTFTLPAHLPSNPYRPSTALDAFVRIRDGLSVIPGSGVSAFDSDLDHVAEYDHADPLAGGQTVPENMNAKDRFGHLLKTFGDWVDDQWVDEFGCLASEFTTPEGLIIPGPPEAMEKLFPGLRRIRFRAPPSEDDPAATTPPAPTPDPPTRSQSRVASKHARRRQERERNRKRREEAPAPRRR